MEEVERQEKKWLWFQISNPILSDTNQGIDEICSNPADTLLSNFFRQEENKEVLIFFLSTFYQR